MDNGRFKHMNTSAVAITPSYVSKEPKKPREWLVNLLIIGIPILLCFILIMVFMFAVDMPPKKPYTSICLASSESNSSDLADVLRRVQRLYFYQLHPEMIYQLRGVTPEDIRKYFRPYDPSPNATKNRTDQAIKLREELNALKFNTTLLKLRERKAVHVANAILMNNFGWAPYAQDYYNGDWLLGPDLFCWQPVCSVFQHLNAVFSYFKPRNMTELEKLRDLFEEYNRTFDRYIENWRLGARTGYVRTHEACKAGLHSIKYQKYRGMTLKNESGIYDEPFAKVLLVNSTFFEDLPKSVNDTWKENTQRNVTTYFKESLIENIANASIRMLKFLEHEYLSNCPTDENIVSGLGKLPLNFRYYDDIPDIGHPAFQKLPYGEELRGAKTYQTLMRFFTTLDITPAELRKRAVTRRDALYRQAVTVAKQYTGEENEVLAVSQFQTALRQPDMPFNSKPFPSNESGDVAFRKCIDPKSAQAYCPQRWKAMQAWINNTFQTAKNNIEPVIKPLFYYSGAKKTVPDCGIDCIAWFHPYASYHLYSPGNKNCTIKASQGLPFFVDTFGPKWTEFTTTAHEQLPGHHLEVQSFIEYFEDECTDAIHWMSVPNLFAAFTEGWATYVEYKLLPEDTKLYSNTLDKGLLLQKYGMIYYQLLAAVRAIVDIDLNFDANKPKSQALSMYRQYLWPDDNTDLANKDILRSQSLPGYVTSYMIGEMEISRVRDIAERELGQDFVLEEFHYEVLRQGEFPLGYLEEHIRAYIACKKDPLQEGCKEF
ncbi:uncharacterized protein LOC144667449 [Oculina patagonica]